MSETCVESSPKPRPRWASAWVAGVFSRSCPVGVRHPRALASLRGGAHRAYTATRREVCPWGAARHETGGARRARDTSARRTRIRGVRPARRRPATRGPEVSDPPHVGPRCLTRHTRVPGARLAACGPHGPELYPAAPHALRRRAGRHRTTSRRPGAGLNKHDDGSGYAALPGPASRGRELTALQTLTYAHHEGPETTRKRPMKGSQAKPLQRGLRKGSCAARRTRWRRPWRPGPGSR